MLKDNTMDLTNFLNHYFFYPDTGKNIQKSSPEESLKSFQCVLIPEKQKSFESFVSMVWQFITEQPPVELYPKIWIDYVVVLAIRFEPYFFYNQ